MAVEGKFQQASVAECGPPWYAYAFTGLAIASIWLSVVLASIFAPDFVSGSQQEHLRLVGWVDWVWGAVATGFVVLAAVQGIRAATTSLAAWMSLGIGIALTWLGVCLVSVFAPVFITGSDPTRIPLAAMGIPILGVFVTWFVCTFVKAAFQPNKA
jgi:hypothetical protein